MAGSVDCVFGQVFVFVFVVLLELLDELGEQGLYLVALRRVDRADRAVVHLALFWNYNYWRNPQFI
jgi:hypothetical protein